MRKFFLGTMRIVSLLILTLFVGGAIGYAVGISPIIPCLVIGSFGFVNLIPAGALGVLVGTYTGGAAYSDSIDAPIARLMIDATSNTALATVTATKLTVTQATKRRQGTIIPEIALGVLAEICGFIDAVYYQMTATFRIIFSIPISLGGAYDPEGGSITYTLSNCTAADTIKVYNIDDAKRELDYIEIVPIACKAGGVTQLNVRDSKFLFTDPTNITRLKFTYASGLSIEYMGAEIAEIARIVNPVHKVTDAGLLTAGSDAIAGINVIDAVQADVTLTADGLVYMFKHLLAS
jgi:hypothetical protein